MGFACFLNIKGIPGECTDEEHSDWIEVLSYSHGVSQGTSGSVSSGGGLTAMRCDHQDFSIVKTLDKSSPKLALFCSKGSLIDEVTVELWRAGDPAKKYMEYKMSQCVISSVNPSGDAKGAAALPLEEVTFAYMRMDWTYTPTKKDEGDIPAWWDLDKNTGG